MSPRMQGNFSRRSPSAAPARRSLDTKQMEASFFLPNFCRSATVFVIILISALTAILLNLITTQDSLITFDALGRQAFFILWVSLVSCATLCALRRWLARFSANTAGLLAWLGIMSITSCLSLVVYSLQENGFAHAVTTTPLLFVIKNTLIASMISALLLRYFYVQHQWRRQTRAESEARVQALQSRIRPHFLFNSMNTIASLTRIDAEKAEQTVEDLADLFRASLADQATHRQLGEEWQLTRQYLRLEGLRLGNRLQIVWAIDALPDDALLPSLTLQPILENAIYHGIEPCAEGGTVRISGQRAGKRLSILIENPIPPETDQKARRGNHIGQENTRQRLTLFFANTGIQDAQMHTKVQDGRYCVSLSFPYITSLP